MTKCCSSYAYVVGLSVFFGLLLSGCNAFIGIPDEMHQQPWRNIYLVSLFIIWTIPALSIVALLFAIVVRVNVKLQLFKAIYIALFIMIFFIMVSELSLTAKTNIRVDLFITMPLLVLQIVLAVCSTFFMRRMSV